ncbi:DUF4041 domain-containing protein [Nocardioides caldifontis]|uniref:DUF4041 domain-containing protein n=1 Tax=Nocardioides caldifontis TaxID=2588938 RepID=UPI00193A1311|nr:DUF4041 domain-containing protein [Nocardioides caldifontis]
MTSTPANWYPDPHDARQLRYWDGSSWTDHRASNPAVQGQQTAAPATPTAGASAPAPQSVAQPTAQAAPAASESKVPLFGARNVAKQQAEELDRLRADMARLGVLDVAELSRQRDQLRVEVDAQRARLTAERTEMERQLADLRQRVVVTQEDEILQEVGVYRYRHPLSDSVAFRDALARVQGQIKTMVRADGGAIEATTSWQVNGSAAEGRKMVRDISKLMLRAYNAEADNLVRGLKPYKLPTAIDRLEKVAFTIAKLGASMSIRVSPANHRLRVQELELTADYQEMLAREKEQEREEKERLREERKVQHEIQRERERLDKEKQHYLNALAALEVKGDAEGAARLRTQLADVEQALSDVDYRAANIRAGYVYVISNIGALGRR